MKDVTIIDRTNMLLRHSLHRLVKISCHTSEQINLKICTFRKGFFLKMKYSLMLFILVLTSSCRYFETEKISTETFYEEELKTIDWNEVDRYPAFSNCENLSEKPAQKTCFENTLSSHLRQTFSNHSAIAVNDLNDTVKLAFSVSNSGKLEVTHIKIDSTTNAEFPLLGEWFTEGIDTLDNVSPAYKRGIPVATQFILPIIIRTKEL